MATRGKRRSASRRSTGGSPLGWFGAGLVLGLAGAVFLFYKGYLPAPPPETTAPGPDAGETAILDDDEPILDEEEGPRYDFFTVLPEMEEVVPQRELSDQARPDATEQNEDPDTGTGTTTGEAFVLQVGSFRSATDAEQMKARLALLGSVASIQAVTVNDETWHRVRVGPVASAREADELRRRLLDDGIDVLVLKVSG